MPGKGSMTVARDRIQFDQTSSGGLAGARVMVVGVGDVLARVLGTLHRLGAACVAVDDPYRAVLEVAGSQGSARGGTCDAVVFALPCLFPGEVAAIRAISKLRPAPIILVAAAEQQLSLLTAAIREGAVGVITERGIEWLASIAPEHATPEPLPEQLLIDDSAETDSAQFDADADSDDADAEFDLTEPTEPLLTAEELKALLHDPIEPVLEPNRISPARVGKGR